MVVGLRGGGYDFILTLLVFRVFAMVFGLFLVDFGLGLNMKFFGYFS